MQPVRSTLSLRTAFAGLQHVRARHNESFTWDPAWENKFKDVDHHSASSIFAPLPKDNVFVRFSKWIEVPLNGALVLVGGTIITTVALYRWLKGEVDKVSRRRQEALAFRLSTPAGEAQVAESLERTLSAREKRFVKFASVSARGQLFMTPVDFLHSLRLYNAEVASMVAGRRRKVLDETEISRIHTHLPPFKRANVPGRITFLRDLGPNGLISCSEYLFLMTVVTKPRSSFKLAFAMLDKDGNGSIDRQEFQLLESLFADASTRKVLKSGNESADGEQSDETDAEEKATLTSLQTGHTVRLGSVESANDHAVETTLAAYLFGKAGQKQLSYEQFRQFVTNVQTEVMHIEFTEYSRASDVISEIDFARHLLKYTHLDTIEYGKLIDRLSLRMASSNSAQPGITFDDFMDFSLFLNNLDDFQVAMRLYTFGDRAISRQEFIRGVYVCTGRKLNPHVADVVFMLFDADGDGQLTPQAEFINLMHDRARGSIKSLKSTSDGDGGPSSSASKSSSSSSVDAFKRCLKFEMKREW